MAYKGKISIGSTILKFLVYLVLAAVIAYLAAVALVSSTSIEQFSIDLLVAMFGTEKVNQWFLIIFGGIVIFILLYFSSVKKSDSDKELKGMKDLENVKWQDEKSLNKNFVSSWFSNLHLISHNGIPFRAVYKRGDIKIYFGPDDAHTLIVGATGTGKGVSFVEPTIQILSELKNKPSMFITDPKGELYARHSQKLHDNGYNVLVFNLIEPYNSLRWNPLESIYDTYQRALHLEEEIYKHTDDKVDNYEMIKIGKIDDAEWYEFDKKAFATLNDAFMEVQVEKTKLRDQCFEDINDIATALCPITDQKNASWEQGARDYVIAVLIAMLEDSENPALGMTKEKFNFYNMYKIAMNKENDMEYVKEYFSGRSPLSKTVQLCAHIVYSNAKQTRDSYMSTLNQKLALFSDNGICYLTSKNEINFGTFDDKPTAFFVKIPDEKETRYGLATVCISQSYKEFVRKARKNEVISKDKSKAKKACLKRPMHYILDEFANNPAIANLDKIITVSRSRKIFLHMVIQSYEQLDKVYGKDVAGIVMGNCKTRLFLGTPSQETREIFSKELGNYQVKVGSKSESKGADGKTTPSSSTQSQSRPLMFPSDLDKLKLGTVIVKIFGSNPINSTITPYFKCTDVYKLGQLETPYIPGKRLNEEEIFYDIRERNRKVLK